MKLELRNVSKRFGAVLANDHLNITIPSGTIHAIVGENGAGKSTAMRIAYGFYRADSGEIVVDDRPRDIRSPHDAIALGIGMVHQHFMLVRPMTVTENIVLGAEPGSALSLDLKKAAANIRALSEEFRLSVDPDAVIEDLSVGQQQRVELLKALYRRAALLILDEPTAVLTPREVDEFFAILRRMREQGKTVVIITHKLSEVLAISDNVTVMRDGRVVGNLETRATNAAELARLMVGRDVLLRVDKPAAKPGAAVLTVRDLSIQNARGNGVKSKGVDRISMINLVVEWTGGPKAENGSYGVYPVTSTNVLIDRVTVRGASDAGIYVGQSNNIIVRNNRASGFTNLTNGCPAEGTGNELRN
jgi:simple sugar transport system ATP-binding protein